MILYSLRGLLYRWEVRPRSEPRRIRRLSNYVNTNPSWFSHERRRSLTYLTYKSITKLAHDSKVPYFPSIRLEHSEVSEGTVFYVLYKVILLCLLESLSKSKSGWSPHSLRIQTMEQCCIVIHIIAAYRGASAPRRTDGFPHH